MLEFRDGTFGPIEPMEEALPKFLDLIPAGEVRAFHVGSPLELKAKRTLEERVSDLTERISSIEKATPLQSDVLHLPSAAEVERFSGDKS